MTFLYLIAVKVKGHMLTFSARSFFWRENREWTCFKPSFSIEFKFPSLKVRKRGHTTPVFQDLPSFEWANLRDKKKSEGAHLDPFLLPSMPERARRVVVDIWL